MLPDYPAVRSENMLRGALLARPDNRGVYFFLVIDAAAGFSSFALGASPITPLSGQILKAGHFSQPVTMAMGQSVMADSVFGKVRLVCACAGGCTRQPSANLRNICQIWVKLAMARVLRA